MSTFKQLLYGRCQTRPQQAMFSVTEVQTSLRPGRGHFVMTKDQSIVDYLDSWFEGNIMVV